MNEAVLRVSLPCSWVTELTAQDGVLVNIVEQKPVGRRGLHTLAEIDPGRAEPDDVIALLRANPFVSDLETIVPPKGRILIAMRVQECHACAVLASSECFLSDATAVGSRGVRWRIVAPTRTAIDRLVHALRQEGFEVTLESITTAKRAGSLTERQDRVLALAYKLGYFEFPKRINLTALAKKLGVAKSTLSEVLRAGEEKILHAYFQQLMKRSG